MRTVDGENYRYEVMLVSKGYTQRHAQLDLAGMLVSLTTHHKWEVYQLDVKSVFLNGLLDEENYVELPEGFIVKGEEHKVYCLKKPLSGLGRPMSLECSYWQLSARKWLHQMTIWACNLRKKVRGEMLIALSLCWWLFIHKKQSTNVPWTQACYVQRVWDNW